MSEDEIFVLIMSGVVAAILWLSHFLGAMRFGRVPSANRIALIATPIIAGATLFAALRTLAAHDVRDAPQYMLLYSLLGAAWVAGAVRFVPLLGVSMRDDALERANPAAASVCAAALFALTLCYIGGNIGDGPGWWVVVFSAALATTALMVTWLALELTTSVSDAVTIDRDQATGLRLAGFLVACGAIFGRGSAGTWVSAWLTVTDFLWIALPVVPLLLLAIFLERRFRPSPSNPRPSTLLYGAVPAALYVTAAISLVTRLGIPE